jgi:hypothetical protein
MELEVKPRLVYTLHHAVPLEMVMVQLAAMQQDCIPLQERLIQAQMEATRQALYTLPRELLQQAEMVQSLHQNYTLHQERQLVLVLGPKQQLDFTHHLAVLSEMVTALLVETQLVFILLQEPQALQEIVRNHLLGCMSPHEPQLVWEVETNHYLQHMFHQEPQMIQQMETLHLLDYIPLKEPSLLTVQGLKHHLDYIHLQEQQVLAVLEIQITQLFITTSELHREVALRQPETRPLVYIHHREQHLLAEMEIQHLTNYGARLLLQLLLVMVLSHLQKYTLLQELHLLRLHQIQHRQDYIHHQELRLILQAVIHQQTSCTQILEMLMVLLMEILQQTV